MFRTVTIGSNSLVQVDGGTAYVLPDDVIQRIIGNKKQSLFVKLESDTNKEIRLPDGLELRRLRTTLPLVKAIVMPPVRRRSTYFTFPTRLAIGGGNIKGGICGESEDSVLRVNNGKLTVNWLRVSSVDLGKAKIVGLIHGASIARLTGRGTLIPGRLARRLFGFRQRPAQSSDVIVIAVGSVGCGVKTKETKGFSIRQTRLPGHTKRQPDLADRLRKRGLLSMVASLAQRLPRRHHKV